jgi:hypothetical protein
MSTTRLPKLPKLPHTHIMLLSDLQSGTEPGFSRWHMEKYAHAYGLAVWKAAIEAAAVVAEDTIVAEYEGCVDYGDKAAAAIRRLPLPEQGGPQ